MNFNDSSSNCEDRKQKTTTLTLISYNNNSDEDKKAKGTIKYVIERYLKFQDCINRLEAAQMENKINHIEKNKTEEDSLKEYKKQFIKNDKLLKTQQIFKSERQNVSTEEIDEIVLSSNDDKRMQSSDQ